MTADKQPSMTQRLRALGLPSRDEYARISQMLRQETVGGGLLVIAAAIALAMANTPAAGAYEALRELKIGPAAVHLDLSLATWAGDGLLAVFFFLVGLELKHEFVVGDLRDARRALVPVVAAVGGVAIPALIYVTVNLSQPAGLRGWAIPTATDIAFALAVLAVIGSHLPAALRTFLLTLAVVDDLIAIVIIAVFYTDQINAAALALAVIPVVAYALLVQRFQRFFADHAWALWVILLPIGTLAWALVHESGIHATIAGVVLGLTVPVRAPAGEDGHGLAHQIEHRLRPISAGLAVPIFAFLSAGVALGGLDGLASALSDPVTLGIVGGLVLGKPIGIMTATWIVTRATHAELDDSVSWIDLGGLSALAGVGFTVSLLLSSLSFSGVGGDHARIGVLLASGLAATLGAGILVTQNRRYREIEEQQDADVPSRSQ